MKQVMIAVLVAVLTSYVMVAFVVWEINPGEWSQPGRAMFVWSSLILAILAAGAAAYKESLK